MGTPLPAIHGCAPRAEALIDLHAVIPLMREAAADHPLSVLERLVKYLSKKERGR
jgi:hypothetical protein